MEPLERFGLSFCNFIWFKAKHALIWNAKFIIGGVISYWISKVLLKTYVELLFKMGK